MAKVTPRAAIVWGLVLVNGPVLVIIFSNAVLAVDVAAPTGMLSTLKAWIVGLGVGAGIAWLWWSFAIARWRDWVEDSGLSPSDVQDAAVRVGLHWPVGSWFERTEFPRRDGRRAW